MMIIDADDDHHDDDDHHADGPWLRGRTRPMWS
jgi:hypothetical protein